ncbi:MAG: hypothetical protein HQ519_03210 [Planctomycetes bacterium]|nr:hypothetical protein [Planctomycetota bacterium]
MRKSFLLYFVVAALAVGTATGYVVRAAAVLVPGTYYIDLGRAIKGDPRLEAQFAMAMKPLQTRYQELKAEAKKLNTEKDQLAIMDPATAEYRSLSMHLKIREETVKGEQDLLVQAQRSIDDEFLFMASSSIHKAVEKLGAEKGYESIVVAPISLKAVPWDNPAQAMELLRQRSTYWIHPDRDVTDELIAILAQ